MIYLLLSLLDQVVPAWTRHENCLLLSLLSTFKLTLTFFIFGSLKWNCENLRLYFILYTFPASKIFSAGATHGNIRIVFGSKI